MASWWLRPQVYIYALNLLVVIYPTTSILSHCFNQVVCRYKYIHLLCSLQVLSWGCYSAHNGLPTILCLLQVLSWGCYSAHNGLPTIVLLIPGVAIEQAFSLTAQTGSVDPLFALCPAHTALVNNLFCAGSL